MNPHAERIALAVVAVAAGAFVVGMIVCTLLYGCASTMPPEPPFVETVSASVRDR